MVTRVFRGYSKRLMDHFMNPRCVGVLEAATGMAEVKNNTCGDITCIYVRLQGGILKEVTFLASGCGPGIACASYLVERCTGKTVREALAETPAVISRALSLPRTKSHAAELAVQALRLAVEASLKALPSTP